MITTPLYHFIAWTLLFWIALIGYLWFRELRRQRKYDWHLSRQYPCTCRACQLTFMMRANDIVTRCPRCNAICARSRRK